MWEVWKVYEADISCSRLVPMRPVNYCHWADKIIGILVVV